MSFGALLGQNPGGSGGFTKNEILAPETPPIYNLGADATPNDMFQNIFAVGDIKVSTRTDLGDNWLLCNGENYSLEQYPELSKITAKKQREFSRKYSLNSPTTIRADAYGSPIYYYSEQMKKWFLSAPGDSYYSDNYNGPWTPMNKRSVIDTESIGITKINDLYILICASSFRNSYFTILQSNSLNGPWTRVDAPSGYNIALTSDWFVHNNRLFILGVENNKFKMVWTDFPATSSTWGSTVLNQSFNDRFFKTVVLGNEVAICGGTYIITCQDITASSPVLKYDTKWRSAGIVDSKWLLSSNDGMYLSNSLASAGDKISAKNKVGCFFTEFGQYVIAQAPGWDGDNNNNTLYRKSDFYSLGSQAAGIGYIVPKGNYVHRLIKGTNNEVSNVHRETPEEFIVGALPEISVTNAHCYIRGK